MGKCFPGLHSANNTCDKIQVRETAPYIHTYIHTYIHRSLSYRRQCSGLAPPRSSCWQKKSCPHHPRKPSLLETAATWKKNPTHTYIHTYIQTDVTSKIEAGVIRYLQTHEYTHTSLCVQDTSCTTPTIYIHTYIHTYIQNMRRYIHTCIHNITRYSNTLLVVKESLSSTLRVLLEEGELPQSVCIQ